MHCRIEKRLRLGAGKSWCGPGLEDQTKGVVLCGRMKLKVWSTDGGSN